MQRNSRCRLQLECDGGPEIEDQTFIPKPCAGVGLRATVACLPGLLDGGLPEILVMGVHHEYPTCSGNLREDLVEASGVVDHGSRHVWVIAPYVTHHEDLEGSSACISERLDL